MGGLSGFLGGPRGYRTPRPLSRSGPEEQLVVAQLRRPSVALWLGLVVKQNKIKNH